MRWLKRIRFWFRSRAKDDLGMHKYTPITPEEADIRNQEILGIRKECIAVELEEKLKRPASIFFRPNENSLH